MFSDLIGEWILKLSVKNRTVFGVIEILCFLTINSYLLDLYSDIEKTAHLRFDCNVTGTKLACLNEFNKKDYLHSDGVVPAAYYWLLLAIHVLSMFFIAFAFESKSNKKVKVSHMQNEREVSEHTEQSEGPQPQVALLELQPPDCERRKPRKRPWHLCKVYPTQISLRMVFYLSMVLYFLFRWPHMIINDKFICPGSVIGSRGSIVSYCTYVDHIKATRLNFAHFGFTIFYILFNMVELCFIYRRQRQARCFCDSLRKKLDWIKKLPKLCDSESNDEDARNNTGQHGEGKLKDKYISKCEKHQINYVEEGRIKLAWMNVDEFAVKLKIAGKTYCGSSFRGEMKRHVERLQDQSEIINLPDLLYNDHRIMFIQGVAGSGKTVFAKQLALKWTMATDKDEIRKKYKHLIFFECRDFNRYLKNDNVDDVIDIFLRKEFSGINLEDGKDSLFLIDGLDEMVSQKTGPISAKSIIEIFISKFPKCKLIVLGRPHVQNSFEGLDCKVFEILGLSAVEIENYVKRFVKFVNQVKNPEQLIKKTMNDSKNISAITTVPQFLNTLCCVAILTNGQTVSSATDLYSWLCYLLLNQHSHLKDPGAKSGIVSEIFSKYIQVFKSISAIAFELYINNDIIFEKETFEHVFEEINRSDDQQKEFFESLFCDVSDNFGERRQFKHLTIMEFIASIYFFFAEDRNRVIEQFLDKKAYECISFICCFEGRKLVRNVSREDISWALVNVLDRDSRETDFPLIIKVFRNLKRTMFVDEAMMMKLMLRFICDTLNPIDEIKDKSLLTEMLEKITPPKRITMKINEIDQMNIFNVIQTAKNNDINDDELKNFFKGIELKVQNLEYVKVIQFACLFDCVEISLGKEELSEDDMILLAKNAVYCRNVSFRMCDFTKGKYLWQELLKHIKEHESDMRIERLEISDMQIADECIDSFAEVLIMFKEVLLYKVAINKVIWNKLFHKIDQFQKEKGNCHLRLECLQIDRMVIADECIDSFSKVLIMLKEVNLSSVTIDKTIWDNLFCNIDQHEEDHSHLRLERLTIHGMKIADECIDSFSKVLAMLKEVELNSVTIDKTIWGNLFCNLDQHEQDHGNLRLERLTIDSMENADECIDSFFEVLIMLKEVRVICVRIDQAKLAVFIRNAKDKGQLNLQSLTIDDWWPLDIKNKIEEAGVNVDIDDDYVQSWEPYD